MLKIFLTLVVMVSSASCAATEYPWEGIAIPEDGEDTVDKLGRRAEREQTEQDLAEESIYEPGERDDAANPGQDLDEASRASEDARKAKKMRQCLSRMCTSVGDGGEKRECRRECFSTCILL